MEFIHKSVLFEETVAAVLDGAPDVVFDGTAGGGGHSGRIAESGCRLYSIDQDPDAIKVLHQRLDKFGNVTIVHDNFSDIKSIVTENCLGGIDCLLLDLGVSSYQLDNGDRGFSFHTDAPIDMRMSKEGMSARDVVNGYSEQELADVIFRYGEERYARSIARNIVKAREIKQIETTFELVDIIKRSMPQRAQRDGHPARRTFQAIRIEVNGELTCLEQTLDDAFECLNPGGRIVVITFHSLEDRIVKEKFASWCKGCTCPKEFPVCVCGNKPKGKVLKPVTPSDDELEENPRARSSRLRVFIKNL